MTAVLFSCWHFLVRPHLAHSQPAYPQSGTLFAWSCEIYRGDKKEILELVQRNARAACHQLSAKKCRQQGQRSGRYGVTFLLNAVLSLRPICHL